MHSKAECLWITFTNKFIKLLILLSLIVFRAVPKNVKVIIDCIVLLCGVWLSIPSIGDILRYKICGIWTITSAISSISRTGVTICYIIGNTSIARDIDELKAEIYRLIAKIKNQDIWPIDYRVCVVKLQQLKVVRHIVKHVVLSNKYCQIRVMIIEIGWIWCPIVFELIIFWDEESILASRVCRNCIVPACQHYVLIWVPISTNATALKEWINPPIAVLRHYRIITASVIALILF